MQNKLKQSTKPKQVDKPVYLWLASWYPNRLDAYTGDFIQRHARAFALFNPLYVLHIAKDEKGEYTQNIKIETLHTGNLIETIIYYHPQKVGIAFIDRMISGLHYLRHGKKWLKRFVENHGSHVKVEIAIAMRAGLLGLWLKRKYDIPYVVKEHWTGYYRQSMPKSLQQTALFWHYTKKILKGAKGLICDSRDLGRQINDTITRVDYVEIPNVVDTKHFYYRERQKSGTRSFVFLHASTMGYQKNTAGIIRQFLKLSRNYPTIDLELRLLGPDNENLEHSFDKAVLKKGRVIFMGNVSYQQVAIEMSKADAFVLFSRFENLPCVLLEAMCCGLPVIATEVGGIYWHVEKDSGILVESENENALYKAMEQLIFNSTAYVHQLIADNASKKYNMHAIGQLYQETYHKFFN